MTTTFTSLARAAGALCAALLLACGDDEGGPGSLSTRGPRNDGGGIRDAAPLPDASAHDKEIFSGDVLLCGYDDDDVLELPGHPLHTEVAIATDETGFGLVYQEPDGSLFIEAVEVMGDALPPVRVVAADQAAQAAALVANENGFLLAFRSGAMLRARALGNDAAASADLAVLSDRLAEATDGGEPFALLAEDDGFVLAAVERADSGHELRLQRLAADGSVRGEPSSLTANAERAPLDLHLATLGSGRVLLSYFERDAEGGGGRVMGIPLSAELQPEGEPAALSKHSVSQTRFDLAARARSVGLVYQAKDGDVRDAIKFRRIEAAGSAEQSVLNIVDAPGRAIAGSIAAFGQGYAIAFRELVSLGRETPTIRIAFVNQYGRIVHEAELGPTTEQGGRTTISATADGHVMVGYTSLFESKASTHAIKMHCPGALVLCGGALE